MRDPEGIATLLPGKSSERTWSNNREPYFRNVEAEGSNPFTSTGRKPWSGVAISRRALHWICRGHRWEPDVAIRKSSSQRWRLSEGLDSIKAPVLFRRRLVDHL